MSGIRVGTRLEQLYKLRDQLAHEIASEERREALEGHRVATPVTTKRSPNVVARRLEWMGVTSRTVRQWALEQGLITEIKRGRISIELVEAYIDAHTQALQDWAS